LITVTGFIYNAFNDVLALFEPFFDKYLPWTGKKDGATYKEVDSTKTKHSAEDGKLVTFAKL